jgi:hypothetical protein
LNIESIAGTCGSAGIRIVSTGGAAAGRVSGLSRVWGMGARPPGAGGRGDAAGEHDENAKPETGRPSAKAREADYLRLYLDTPTT